METWRGNIAGGERRLFFRMGHSKVSAVWLTYFAGSANIRLRENWRRFGVGGSSGDYPNHPDRCCTYFFGC